MFRNFSTTSIRRLNPILPFDILEELDHEDTEKEKEKLEKENKDLKNGKRKPKEDLVGVKFASGGGKRPSDEEKEKEKNKKWERFQSFAFKCFETAGITFASLLILGSAGLLYHNLYQSHVINKMERLFDVGDPLFELTMHNRTNKSGKAWVERPQQELLDDIIKGEIRGRYFLLIGEKGTGKTSMILELMRKMGGKNCTFLDAHADPEIFRIRLGRALNFEFHEDYIGSLFSIRGPRDTTAILDIERAFNKLEEVAVNRVKKTGSPLIFVINNAHLIRDDADGINLVELLQQKAETLSGSGLVTMIFNSDDYWLYERLKKLGTRLEVVNVRDLNKVDLIDLLRLSRGKNFDEVVDDSTLSQIYQLIGGRPQHLAYVAAHKDMISLCHSIIDREKTWLLNQCSLLGDGMDDDVMESGKFSTSLFLLVQALVDMDRKRTMDGLNSTERHILPELPLWRANQIMTRSDYIQRYDNLNIFTIDSHSRVRADSVPMMRAFHEIASQPGFNELLNETCERVALIESLGRTREIVLKDLVNGNSYNIKNSEISLINREKKLKKVFDQDGNIIKIYEVDADEEEDDDPISMEDIDMNRNTKKWWRKRMELLGVSYIPDGFIESNNDPSETRGDLSREGN